MRGFRVFFLVTLYHNYLMNVLQKIFRDNYEIIQYTLHPRDVVMESIDKMINCGDPSFGGAMSFKLIKCPHHHCIFTEAGIIEMFYISPKTIVRESTLSNKTMNMRIPFERSSKSV